MSTTKQMREEAEDLATLRNARVITRAFREASISCPHCKFPENAGEFYSLLHQYTRARIDVHRAYRDDYQCITYCTGETCHRYELEGRAAHLRTQLRFIWPCDECTRKYNPTGRIRVKHMGVRYTVHKLFPQKKDFLE